MQTVKVKITRNTDAPEQYYQGEYHADLTKTYAEVPPTFAAHLVGAGLAEYLKKDEPKPAEPLADADLQFVARQTPELPKESAQPQPVAPPIPTEEITIGAKDAKKGSKK